MSGEAQFHEKKLLVASVARSLDLIDDAALDKQRDRVANRQLSAESAAMLRARPATDARNLRDLLMPIALQSNESSAIAKNAWFPYVAASLRLAVHHLETMGTAAADALWNEMESVTVWPNVHSSFVSLLLSHAAALIDAKRPILQFLQDSSKFVSLCANRYDRSLVLQALNGHVNETILGGLLRQSETSTGLSCCETLKSMLVDYGYWKRMDHVMALDSGASTTSVVLRLVGSLELLVRDVAARVADEIDALVATVIDIVTALVDLTAQAPTGRFLSWWITHRSCKPTSSRCDALGWLGWLQRATSVAPFHSRQLACLVVRLECNVVPFLARPRSSSAPAAPYPAFAALSAPEAHQARWALLASLLGTDAALPDAQYIADLVAQRLHVPKLGVHFLDVDDYCARHLALYKAHVCWQLWQELTESGAGAGDEQQSVFAIDEIGHLRADDADDGCSLAVTCRSTRASLSADGARGGKPSTFVVLTSGSDDAHAVVVVTEYVSHQSERNGTQHVHRLRLRTEVPAAGDLGALHSLRLTNPALAGSLAVLQTLRSCSATIRATPWLARFLLGTARAAELVALQSVDDRAGDLRYVLAMGVFPTAAVLSDCIGQAQTLARDNVQISLSTADPQRCVSLQVENAAPLEIELSGGTDGAFRPYAAQQEALLSALTRRLTLVIGPPGTGKTDTAVLMIVAMLGRFRGARLLVSAVSNLALDQLIDKLVAFAPTAVLLRLGGQTQLDVARRFTVDGIVAARSRHFVRALHDLRAAARGVDARDTILYDMLELLSTSTPVLGEADDNGAATAEAAPIPSSFWRSDPWRQFVAASSPANGALARALPDHAATLAEMRAIGELLALSHVQREVALMRGCSLVFATTTGMAMRHRRLREGGIAFPLVMMEEAAKVLETEALTCFAHGVERIVLIGDHLQLPPLVAADSLRSASVNYSQSLFARLLRAGVAPITLNRQGRAAPGIADLYRFRYDNLLDLPATRNTATRWPLRDAASFVDVADGRFKKESNAAEVTAVVRFYERLLAAGVDASRVSVLSPYRSQCRALEHAFAALSSRPRDIATTDAFQGLQNEVVLVSLVSVNSLSAHMRDAARIVVLLSRARVGLVLFGHFATFWADTEWRKSLTAAGATETGPREIVWQSAAELAASTSSASEIEDKPASFFPGTKRDELDDEAEKIFAQLADLKI